MSFVQKPLDSSYNIIEEIARQNNLSVIYNSHLNYIKVKIELDYNPTSFLHKVDTILKLLNIQYIQSVILPNEQCQNKFLTFSVIKVSNLYKI